MKKNLLLLAMLAFTALGFTACNSDKDEETSDENVVLPTPEYKAEVIKLSFVQAAEYDEQYNITQLELTESGTYIFKLEKKQDIAGVKATRAGISSYKYLFDSYTKMGTLSYKLQGFGTVILEKNGDKYTVTLSFGGKTITVDATAIINSIANDQKTLNLCRKWTVVSTRVQIEGVSAFYNETGCNINSILEYIKQHAQITDVVEANQVVTGIEFSTNGSFSLYYANGDIDKSTWQWVDQKKGSFSYKWDFSDMGYSFVNGQASVVLKAAGKESQLKLAGTVKNNKGENKPITITVNMK